MKRKSIIILPVLIATLGCENGRITQQDAGIIVDSNITPTTFLSASTTIRTTRGIFFVIGAHSTITGTRCYLKRYERYFWPRVYLYCEGHDKNWHGRGWRVYQ